MGIIQARSKRKVSGGRYKAFRKKRNFETAHGPTNTKIGKTQTRCKRVKGGNQKLSILKTEVINLVKDKKHIKAKILTVKECPANRNFVRRNILTKGTIVETDKGLAKITNRPGQEGAINGVLVDKKN